MNNKTFKGGTDTFEGMIAHKRMTIGGCTFDAPVKMQGKPKLKGDSTYPVPKKIGGRYMYALPGGYETAGDA